MNELLIFLAYVAGGLTGFIVAAFLAAGARHEEATFDGGFNHDNTSPPVRTVIWCKHVNNKED